MLTSSEHVIQILRFPPLQPDRKKIPIKKAKNGSIHLVTPVRWTSLERETSRKRSRKSSIGPFSQGVPVAAIANFRFGIFLSESPKDR